MDENHRHTSAHLFLIRIWLDQGGEGEDAESSGHGKIQHVITGETHTFSDWSSLVAQLASLASAQSGLAPEPLGTVDAEPR